MEPLRILLVDDHVLFRKGLAALLGLRPSVKIVGEAGDGLQAIELARQLVPDIILMDLHMPECDGLQAVRRIKEELPQVQVIMLTVSDHDDDLFAAIKSGARGYLLKTLEPSELFDMLEGTRQGEAAISRTLASKILQEFAQPAERAVPRPEAQVTLTPRETEVLRRVVAGDSNRQIAEALVVSRNTVKNHLRSILDKLQVKNRLQAAVYAVREGILDDDASMA